MFRHKQKTPEFLTSTMAPSHDKISAVDKNYKALSRFRLLSKALSVSKSVTVVQQHHHSTGNVVIPDADRRLMAPSQPTQEPMQLELSPMLSFDATADTETVQRQVQGLGNTFAVEPLTPRQYAAGIEPLAPRQYAAGAEPPSREYRALVFDGLDDIETDDVSGIIRVQPIPPGEDPV